MTKFKFKFEVLSIGRACDYGWANDDNDWRVELNTRSEHILEKLEPYINFLYDGNWRTNNFIATDYHSPDRALYFSCQTEKALQDELAVLSLMARAIQAYEEDLRNEI